MKIFSLSLLTIGFLALTSCKKDNISPATSPAATTVSETVTVEYRIHANSAHFRYEYLQPNAEGKAETVTGYVNKSDKSFFITWKKNETLFVKAKNYSPSGDEVVVEIYADGKQIANGTANYPNAWAIAEGSAK